MQTPIFDTGKEQAAFERSVAAERARQAREQNSRKTDPAADIKRIKAKAKEFVENDSIGSRDRMVHLKDAARNYKTEFSNQELKQYLWDALRELAGAAEPVPRGGKLNLSKARWLWAGVVMAATTTLVIALPKVGKPLLMTMMLGRIRRGDSSFLGQALPAAKPLVLIVGPDQTGRSVCFAQGSAMQTGTSTTPSSARFTRAVPCT